MTLKTFKYSLANYKGTVRGPAPLRVTHFDYQNDEPFMWAIVDTDLDDFELKYSIVDTGERIPSAFSHTGSVVRNGMAEHLFTSDTRSV